MAMAAGGDVLLQCLEELRDLRQQVHEGESRTAEQLAQVKEDVGMLQRSVSTLADRLNFTRQTHERYFDKIGRALNVFADLQSRNRDQLDDHERRLKLLENR